MLHLLVHGRHVAALHLLQAAFHGGIVALLETGLTFRIRLGALYRQAVKLDRRGDGTGVVELAHDQVTLARGLALLAQGNQFRVRLQGRLALATQRFKPGQYFGCLLYTSRCV